jgi:serine/threonine protein kinase/Flp pilus assembly protein TadD
MGVVYLAEDPVLHRKVAIKMLDLSLEEGSEREFLRDRLLRDARAAATLSHPNIVSIHDVIEEGGAAYVVMEHLAGDSLSAYLKLHPRPDHAFVVKTLRAMAAGLDYTHSHGIVHRDIKPANVMFDASGTVKILDFGIARLSEARTSTPTGMVMGTVEYMSPEQIKGEPIDGRADQFSLAAVAYQMMTGSTLFGHHTLATLTYKIVNEMPPSALTRNAALPATVDVVLAKALSKSPDGRFDSCTAFVDALDLALSPVPRAASPLANRTELTTQLLPPSAQPVQVQPARRAGLIAMAAVLAVLIVGASVLMIWKPWVRRSVPVAATAPVSMPKPPANPPRPEPATPLPPPVEKETPPEAAPLNQAAPAVPATQPAANPPQPQSAATPPRSVEKKGPARTATAAVSVTKPAAKPPQPASSAPLPPPIEKKAPAEASTRSPGLDVPPSVSQPKPQSPPAEPVEQRAPETDNSPAPQPAVQAYERGRDLLKGHNYAAAIQSFTSAISLRRDFVDAYHFRGLAYQRLDQNVAAIKDYSEAIRIRPGGALSYCGRGICLARLHEDDRALADFNQTLNLRPDSPDSSPAFNGRGVIFLRRRQYNSALHDFNAAIRLSPGFEIAYRNRGRVKQALGDQSGAAADFRKADELRVAAPISSGEL